MSLHERIKQGNVSESFKRINPELFDSHSGTPAKLESNLGHGAVGALQVQAGTGQRFFIRLTSYRRRLLDEDNLCEKYHVDLCRYAGALSGDEAGRTQIQVCQKKVGRKEPEFTHIEIYEVNPKPTE